MQKAFVSLLKTAEKFDSASVSGLLRSAPDLAKHLAHVKGMFKIENDGRCPLGLTLISSYRSRARSGPSLR